MIQDIQNYNINNNNYKRLCSNKNLKVLAIGIVAVSSIISICFSIQFTGISYVDLKNWTVTIEDVKRNNATAKNSSMIMESHTTITLNHNMNSTNKTRSGKIVRLKEDDYYDDEDKEEQEKEEQDDVNDDQKSFILNHTTTANEQKSDKMSALDRHDQQQQEQQQQLLLQRPQQQNQTLQIMLEEEEEEERNEDEKEEQDDNDDQKSFILNHTTTASEQKSDKMSSLDEHDQQPEGQQQQQLLLQRPQQQNQTLQTMLEEEERNEDEQDEQDDDDQKSFTMNGTSTAQEQRSNKKSSKRKQNQLYREILKLSRRQIGLVDTRLGELWQNHQVGGNGTAVRYARMHKFGNRYKGLPPSMFNLIDAAFCHNDTTTTTIQNVETIIDANFSSSSPRMDDLSNITASIEEMEKNISLTSSLLPIAILIGVEKGGTTALAQYIHEHPDISRTAKEVHVLDTYIDSIMMSQNIISDTNQSLLTSETVSKESVATMGIPRQKVRNYYTMKLRKQLGFRSGWYALDMTPFYMFLSDRIPQRIMCIVPNAQVFAILRNPIDRAMSHYEMVQGKNDFNGRPKVTFDEFVKADIAALKETGVIQDWDKVDFNKYAGSKEEFNAWRIYINSGLNAPVGMGLYSIQLRHFLNEFDRYNKPRRDFMVIRNEDLLTHTNETYFKVLRFLGLRRIPLKSYEKANTAEERKTVRPVMSNETRKLLYDIFEPYNRQLATLLGPEWNGIWKME